ncbi:elongation factor P [Candidatus Peregrinibacteria bacterium]|nr:elongation factor P [Candidatus Peregrinibacteria bacterium]
MPKTTNIIPGIAIEFKDQPWIVVSTQFENPGKGQAFTRARMRNLKTDQVLENTFKSGEAVELVETARKKCQFLYSDGNEYNFMDNENYEQFSLSGETIGASKRFMLDGTECYALYIEGTPLSIQLPPKMDFKVTETVPGVKGDTAQGGSKDCTIETGATVKVPLFVKEGDLITVNTESGEYVGKA